jgi:predicted transcriptional regulator
LLSLIQCREVGYVLLLLTTVKPEESVKDALNQDRRKLQAQIEVIGRGDSVAGASNQPMKVLKTESTFAKSFGQRGYAF